MRKILSLLALLFCAFTTITAQTNINGEDVGWGDIQSYVLTYMLDGQLYYQTEVEQGAPVTPLAAPSSKEGYTFSGWSGVPSTMPAQDVTVTGSFTVNQYKLTYKVDGAEYKTVQVKYGSAITAEQAPEKEGHTFSGWSGIPETMPAKDVTVTGSFAVNQYKLTYLLDGKEYSTSMVDYGTAITLLEDPESEGQTFTGWKGAPATMPAHDVTITGSFATDTYTLTYMVDGVEYRTLQVKFGEAVTAEQAPEKEGHTFSGWSGIPETMPAQDVTVTGSFTVNQYKLTYMLDGKEYSTSMVDYGTAIILLEAPESEGQTFTGWKGAPATMPAHDVTITGSFNIDTYTLTYMVDGVEYRTLQVKFGEAVTAEPAPEKEGYTFSGWSEIPSIMPAKDVTVTGNFTVNQYKLTYLLDGKEYSTSMVDYGTAITLLEDPESEGQTFTGWKGAPETMPAHDVTITGSFNTDTYTLTYIVDGVEYRTLQIKYGDVITAEPAPEKEGYTFSGWSGIPETMPAQDVTVTGSFTVNKYKLTYMLNGNEYLSRTLAFGSTVVPASEPEGEGYTFSGWSEIPATMPAHDVTVSGTFEPTVYQITYKIDGETVAVDSVAYGKAIVPFEAPEKEGYTFDGWSYIPSKMPAGDITVIGSYSETDAVLPITAGSALTVYNIAGQEIARLTDRSELENLAPGIYLVRDSSRNSNKVEKMVIR